MTTDVAGGRSETAAHSPATSMEILSRTEFAVTSDGVPQRTGNNLDPWYANYAESGGRVLGEACHFLDYFCCLFGSKPVRVFAQTTWPAAGRLPFPDSVTAQVEFADGSSGQLIYKIGRAHV